MDLNINKVDKKDNDVFIDINKPEVKSEIVSNKIEVIAQVRGPKGEAGQGLTEGGTVGQILSKKTDDDFDTEWVDIDLSVFDTDDLSEGENNLYFKDSRAVSAITGNEVWKATDWNTAFSWGNHAGLYDLLGTGQGLINTHEETYDHDLIETALQEETDPLSLHLDQTTPQEITGAVVADHFISKQSKTFTYNLDGTIDTITFSGGRVITYSYTDGEVVSWTDTIRTWTVIRDVDGNITNINIT